ncbi:MAG: DUF362 domain-containing protein [Candidatus Aminicenantales bacterium]
MATLVLVKTADRKQGVSRALELFDFPSVKGKRIFLKPNFNTSDPAPGSTHNDTLTQIILELNKRGAKEITLGERSGPPPTEKVMVEKGIFDLARELGFRVMNFEELEEKEWIHLKPAGCHWRDGFYLPRCLHGAEYVVSTCCLKTHQFGGIFTLSLKLSVGVTPKSLMRELHTSPHMRKMIAEINLGYRPHLIILDGIEAFVDGGPSRGKRKNAEVIIVGSDRIAVDAAGVAVLKELGSNEDIMNKKIFEQEQISRAVELGLGITGPDEIEFITPDESSQLYAGNIKKILARG